MQRTDIKHTTIFILLFAALHCKSWGKFWDGEATSATAFSLSDRVNFSSANFQASIYSGNSLWNDYVKNDGAPLPVTLVSSPFTSGSSATGQSTRLTATGTACSATQTGGYGTCIHAGMIRSFTISGQNSCSGLQVEDSVGAFHWICDASTTPLRVASVGFKEGKYLSDLIDFTNVKFKSMSVTVTYQGQNVTSTPSVWWLNPVSNVVSGSYGATQGIYLLQSNLATSMVNQADKTALLVKPGITISTPSGVLINNNAKNFTWYEGAMNLNSTASAGLTSGTSSFVVVANFAATNGPSAANDVYQITGKNNYLRGLRFGNATIASQISLNLGAGGDANLVNGLQSFNDEFPLKINSSNNFLLQITTANNAQYTDFQSSAVNNVIVNYTHANSPSLGSLGAFVFNVAGPTNNTFMNLGLANNGTNTVNNSAAGAKTQYINLASHNPGVSPDIVSVVSSNLYISGLLKIVATGTSCSVGGVNSGVSNTCTTVDASDFTAIAGLTPLNSYVGKIAIDDPLNASDTNGVATYSISNDWIKFANPFRGYGIDGGAFPVAGNQNKCSGGSCRIWDWSLRSTDSQYRNVLPIPDGNLTAGHKWSAVTQPTCTQPGAQWISGGTCDRPPYPGNSTTCTATGGALTSSACLTTFLRNAYEIIDDGIGNENGLCESNEACIYTPNIASYQGHGSLTCIRGPADLGCTTTFTNGTISNVVLYQYATNGY